MPKAAETRKIKSKVEFQELIGHGHRVKDRFVTLYYIKRDDDVSGVGFSVARGIKKAVDRNRLRRRIREGINSISLRPGYDLVFVVRAQAVNKNFWQIREALTEVLAKAGVLWSEEL